MVGWVGGLGRWGGGGMFKGARSPARLSRRNTVDEVWRHLVGLGWAGMGWDGLGCYGMVRYGMVRYGMVWHGMVWYGMAWYGMVWYGMVWYGWYGMV